MVIDKIKNWVNIKSSAWHFSSQYSVEAQLIKGIHKNSNTNQSILHFSFNKSATQYVKSILVKCATEVGITHVGINEYAFNNKFPFLDHLTANEMKQYQHIFKRQGFVYSVFGGMVEGIPELEEYKIVLGVRDPRDMLVSSYFSQAFSHPVPDKNGSKHDTFMYRRQKALESGIDKYVLDESIRINCIFEKYFNLLLKPYQHVHVTRYEDMISNFESWLGDLLTYCDLKPSECLKNKIMENNRMLKPHKEDSNKHIRKGMAGDYMEKLQPETIKQLNEILSSSLVYFGYSK